ncbi:sigma factor-like helix-turn-helix DNA-binding protein [Sphingosinicella sp. BN140058]|uniref:sigma factor-like helix-turn-helix DNA-binding protein n=1 Tax=Sphingosinicella sp. BN140058 TaxID=1892855 RepID=UPI0010128018|nr:sigma factor-like helix-turn-helix DNA-binding protein [Sphingosinicella sp. BN140058]QAY80412.1 sigma-70 family RNA polymerase sigma factor [Sphingosinicella sp. BN140058]
MSEAVSKVSIRLEALVAEVIANRPEAGAKQTARQRHNTDRSFAALIKVLEPRTRHFTRQYGLVAHREDAEQASAIAVHRAITAYDPTKAQFTTFVNWQIRGEMQSLRFRLMADQRSSAKKVEATTVSMEDLPRGPDGQAAEITLEDPDALDSTEARASAYLAKRATDALVDLYMDKLRAKGVEQLKKRPRAKQAIANQPSDVASHNPIRRPAFRQLDAGALQELDQKLARDRAIIERRVFDADSLSELNEITGITRERVRQITKRAGKGILQIAAQDPRFEIMAAQTAIGSAEKPPTRASKRSDTPVYERDAAAPYWQQAPARTAGRQHQAA